MQHPHGVISLAHWYCSSGQGFHRRRPSETEFSLEMVMSWRSSLHDTFTIRSCAGLDLFTLICVILTILQLDHLHSCFNRDGSPIIPVSSADFTVSAGYSSTVLFSDLMSIIRPLKGGRAVRRPLCLASSRFPGGVDRVIGSCPSLTQA